MLHDLFPDVTVWDFKAYMVAGLFFMMIGVGVLLALAGLAGPR
jgi:hypothetical protein